MNEVKWITKNGVHIPITNEYMNNKIRRKNKKENSETDKSAVGTYEVYKNGNKCNIEVRQMEKLKCMQLITHLKVLNGALIFIKLRMP